ncbi:lysylphosphatidylglycerol synthase transmembrane domain-containing protein [Cardinium endosymbiont of Culicoides punctatus]|uniref:lysylphosphatidylglycerol synthase transmembrane domain-containing protein n=1 Tax=Cardinium endosymbiont of Culicoides punctatus TaxID=2304601 RepID=UPI0010585B83|nr:lysylphosphatidylglycerol synthase transmembrane domain-containing protein [Cardinium endosymbiont of Culicoides punctatus]TDG95161.1 hypothetical protein CCPUN_05800 [Cardinium endosymbiont of Culicoides punctatus]
MNNQIETNAQEALQTLNIKKVWLPILFGLAITVFLFYRSGKISKETISLLKDPNWKYICMALCSIILREIGHICRLRFLSDSTLSWTSCFYIAILWEFASAVTPSVVGGGIVAIFLFSKEGLSLGKSLSYVIVNGIMDNFFFLLAGFHAFLGGYETLFAMTNDLATSVKAIFFTNYFILAIYTSIISIGVFINPLFLKWILMRVTSITLFKRWRRSAYELSKDIITTSNEFRGKHIFFWFRILLCTILTWGVRYAFLNCLIAAYSPITFIEHFSMFGKQIIMWAIMLIPISPGGSGIAEVLFQQFFETTLGDYTLVIAVLWRMCTFYIYLTLGILFLPRWIHRVFTKKESPKS